MLHVLGVWVCCVCWVVCVGYAVAGHAYGPSRCAQAPQLLVPVLVLVLSMFLAPPCVRALMSRCTLSYPTWTMCTLCHARCVRMVG